MSNDEVCKALDDACGLIRKARLQFLAGSKSDGTDAPEWTFLYDAQKYLAGQMIGRLRKNSDGEWEIA